MITVLENEIEELTDLMAPRYCFNLEELEAMDEDDLEEAGIEDGLEAIAEQKLCESVTLLAEEAAEAIQSIIYDLQEEIDALDTLDD